MGNIVPGHRGFPRYLTDTCHGSTPADFKRARILPKSAGMFNLNFGLAEATLCKRFP
jgi:hypothetical protein